MSTLEDTISAHQMKQVLEVTRLLAVTPDLDTLLTRIAESATDLLGAERASIFLHDATADELWTKVALGTKEIRVPAAAGIVGHAFHTNEFVEVPRPYDDPRFNRDIDRRSGFVTRNLLTVPARDIDRKPIGVLQVVNRIGGDFTENDRIMLEMLAQQAGVAIQRHYLMQEVVKSAELRHEMDLAHQVQAAMIPQHPPQIPGLTAVGWTLSASVTGGDVYDLWTLPDGRMGIFLGDASGHGIAPAIVVSQARTLLRALSEINCDPAWLLQRVNSRLIEDLEAGRFVTAFAGCLASDGALAWCSAGHGPMCLRRSGDLDFELLDPLAPPIGVVPDLICDPAGPITLGCGGTLLIMSDGIFEARNPQGDLFEIDRVLNLLRAHPAATPADLLALLRNAVEQWQGKTEPDDDQSIVILHRA